MVLLPFCGVVNLICGAVILILWCCKNIDPPENFFAKNKESL